MGGNSQLIKTNKMITKTIQAKELKVGDLIVDGHFSWRVTKLYPITRNRVSFQYDRRHYQTLWTWGKIEIENNKS